MESLHDTSPIGQSENRTGPYAVIKGPEDIDDFLIEHLTPETKLLICALLDRRESKDAIMQTIVRVCGDARSIVALGCEAFIDREIEQRLTTSDC